MIVPPMASPSMSGVIALRTSMPSSTFDETSERSTARSFPSVDGRRTPLTVTLLNLGESPRMATRLASPPERWIETPGSRPMDSAALLSGSSWMRSRETTLPTVEPRNCSLMAPSWPATWAVTTTSSNVALPSDTSTSTVPPSGTATVSVSLR